MIRLPSAAEHGANPPGIRRLFLPCSITLLSLLLNIVGLDWGLPSIERSQYYPKAAEWYSEPQNSSRLYQTAPYESYHPDEGALLNALSNMDPAALDFNPHFFNYPTLSVYLTGAVLAMGDVVGYVQVGNSKDFYLRHPEQMARVYLLGRLLVAVMSAASVLLLYLTAKLLFDARVAFLSAASLAIGPLWVRDSHFMLVNVPSAAWMVAVAFTSVYGITRRSSGTVLVGATMAGLAASTKYPAGVVVILVFFSLVIGLRQGTWTKGCCAFLAIAACALFALGFLIGTPYALLSSREFLRDVMFEGQDKLGMPSLRMIGSQMIVAFGPIHLVVIAAGAVIASCRIRQWQDQFVLIWALVGLTERLVSDAGFIRYLIPAIPPLAIFGGIALGALQTKVSAVSGRAGWGYVASLLLLLPGLGYTVNNDLLMSTDDVRNRVASWLVHSVAPGQTIVIPGSMYYDMPPINVDRYRISYPAQTSALTVSPTVVFSSRRARTHLGGQLQESHVDHSGLRVFTQRPWSLWTFPVDDWPLDWDYTFIDVYVWLPPDASQRAP